MIQFRKEGEEIKNGINLYPFGDKDSLGCVIKIGPYIQWLRYSKTIKKFHFQFYKVTFTEWKAPDWDW